MSCIHIEDKETRFEGPLFTDSLSPLKTNIFIDIYILLEFYNNSFFQKVAFLLSGVALLLVFCIFISTRGGSLICLIYFALSCSLLPFTARGEVLERVLGGLACAHILTAGLAWHVDGEMGRQLLLERSSITFFMTTH